jgi:RNA polymerase sigma factor (sigma-70 family)
MFCMSAEAESSLATRPSLLARLKDWNQETAWRDFDHHYAPLVRNVARKAGLNDAEADEVAQETLIAIAKKIGEFKHAGNRGSFRSWLYQQTRWRIADQFRARARSRSASESHPLSASVSEDIAEGSGGTPELDQTFERLWEAEWEGHIRETAVARIKRQAGARQFQLFDLHVLQGLPVKAAAEAAGSTMAAVFMAKSRVGRMVRREIARLKAADLDLNK